MPPVIGSPAIDPPEGASINTDQRGFFRDSQRDIGAVEYREESDAEITSQFLHLFWADDADQDGLPYAMERLHGTQPFLPDIASASTLSLPVIVSNGHSVLTFTIADDPQLVENRTVWKLMRSLDLQPGSFHQIYRYPGAGAPTVPGVTADYNSTIGRVTITDTLPAEGGRAFYRLEAVLDSPDGHRGSRHDQAPPHHLRRAEARPTPISPPPVPATGSFNSLPPKPIPSSYRDVG